MPTAFSMWNHNLTGINGGGRGTVRANVLFYSAAQSNPPYVNVVDITHELPARIVNRLLVKHSGGLFAIDDVTGQQQFGEVVEDYLTIDIADRLQAEEQAWKHMFELTSTQPAITVTLPPTGNNDVPYVHFNVGDWIYAPTETLASAQYRVVGITITGDDEGNAAGVVVELNRRTFSIEAQRESLFQTLGSGVVGTAPPSEKVDGFQNSGD